MLMIRMEQMEALREHRVRQFENQLVAHLNRHYPKACRALGEEGVLEAVRYGIQQAGTYDILIEYDVSLYINLMFSFGRDFDTDAALGWAARILKDENISSGSVKMDRLYKAAKKHLPQAAGILGKNE